MEYTISVLHDLRYIAIFLQVQGDFMQTKFTGHKGELCQNPQGN